MILSSMIKPWSFAEYCPLWSNVRCIRTSISSFSLNLLPSTLTVVCCCFLFSLSLYTFAFTHVSLNQYELCRPNACTVLQKSKLLLQEHVCKNMIMQVDCLWTYICCLLNVNQLIHVYYIYIYVYIYVYLCIYIYIHMSNSYIWYSNAPCI